MKIAIFPLYYSEVALLQFTESSYFITNSISLTGFCGIIVFLSIISPFSPLNLISTYSQIKQNHNGFVSPK